MKTFILVTILFGICNSELLVDNSNLPPILSEQGNIANLIANSENVQGITNDRNRETRTIRIDAVNSNKCNIRIKKRGIGKCKILLDGKKFCQRGEYINMYSKDCYENFTLPCELTYDSLAKGKCIDIVGLKRACVLNEFMSLKTHKECENGNNFQFITPKPCEIKYDSEKIGICSKLYGNIHSCIRGEYMIPYSRECEENSTLPCRIRFQESEKGFCNKLLGGKDSCLSDDRMTFENTDCEGEYILKHKDIIDYLKKKWILV